MYDFSFIEQPWILFSSQVIWMKGIYLTSLEFQFSY